MGKANWKDSRENNMNDTNKPQIFKPNEDMLKVLEASMDLELKPTISAMMDKAGVDRKQWYRWIEKKEFVAWWNDRWQEYMGSNMFHLDKISYMKSATDFRYMELLQMKYGKYARKEEKKLEGKIDITLDPEHERIIDNFIERKYKGETKPSK